ncbi:MAG: excinuclease ABC subunit UvrB [Mycoplasmataceae bacterium]|nr:excinuclease ABC subunit UvrB [Mycoplasmataceae bacterium]
MKKKEFDLRAKYIPTGDQPSAIKQLNNNLKHHRFNVLLGATGTGKTFTVANIIQKQNVPTLIIAPNKTLANQLYLELKGFFPNNRVEYYISNFDFYQPEAYKPKTDTYIDKQSIQNWQIEMMRMSSLASLTSRTDVIVVASVASIYGLTDPAEFSTHNLNIVVNDKLNRNEFLGNLVKIGYKRSLELKPGTFVANGDLIEIAPSWSDQFNLRIELFGDVIEMISEIDSLNKTKLKTYHRYVLAPANPNVVSNNIMAKAIVEIKKDLKKRIDYFEQNNLLIERQRIEQRVNFDLEQLQEYGYTSGIENYSWYFGKRGRGAPPYTLFDFFPKDYLLIIDESHLTIPQIRGMYAGDRARKETLVNYGFRLPTALDNRPLNFIEYEKKVNKVIFVSATPADYEFDKAKKAIAEQIIRPTGLLDPIIEVRTEKNQIESIIEEIQKRKKINERVFINTTTKKLAEDIAAYISEKGLSVAYMHSDLKTFERTEVIRKLRVGMYDAIVGINLLREGLDVPEVSFLAILDADKSGFLRNARSLIQMIGRVARNQNGLVAMYANTVSSGMKEAIEETKRRRELQIEYNKIHHIIPKTIVKPIPNPLIEEFEQRHEIKLSTLKKSEKIKQFEIDMSKAAKAYDFETAIKLRDLITELKGM